jgi:hypothetical protein
MKRTSPTTPRSSFPVGAILAAAGLASVVVAYTAGRWIATPAPAPRAAAERTARAEPPARGERQATPWYASGRFTSGAAESARGAPEAQATPPAPPAAAPQAAPAGRPTPELVARVAHEASRVLEAARPDLAARCAPSGAGGAQFTFNVTFDANGREIARGISEDRRHRAPKVASCLRRLPLGALRVTPPGANVGVRVAMKL